MKFWYRFAYYLGGFAIGLVFVFFILNGKDASCAYFPNARVLKNIRTKPFHYAPPAMDELAKKWVDTADVRMTLTYGDVDFGRSNVTHNGGKLYIVEGKTKNNTPLELKIVNYESKAVLEEIVKKKE